MSIKDNIKYHLLSVVRIEKELLMKRKAIIDDTATISELYQIQCEENFINKLIKVINSI